MDIGATSPLNGQAIWLLSTELPIAPRSRWSRSRRRALLASSPAPRWQSLALPSSRNNRKTQVWLLNRLGGGATHLADTPQGVDDFEWSPDRTRLVLILRDPKPEDLEAAKDKDKD